MSQNVLNHRAEDLAAEITEAAYATLLQQGLRRPFVDVELELWHSIRSIVAGNGRVPVLAEVA